MMFLIPYFVVNVLLFSLSTASTGKSLLSKYLEDERERKTNSSTTESEAKNDHAPLQNPLTLLNRSESSTNRDGIIFSPKNLPNGQISVSNPDFLEN